MKRLFPDVVREADYREALRETDYTIVLCAWMPFGADWTSDFRGKVGWRRTRVSCGDVQVRDVGLGGGRVLGQRQGVHPDRPHRRWAQWRPPAHLGLPQARLRGRE